MSEATGEACGARPDDELQKGQVLRGGWGAPSHRIHLRKVRETRVKAAVTSPENTTRDVQSRQPHALAKHHGVHPVPPDVVQEVSSSDGTSQDHPLAHQLGFYHLHVNQGSIRKSSSSVATADLVTA